MASDPLHDLVAVVVREALSAQRAELAVLVADAVDSLRRAEPPPLLDRAALARALGVSVPTVDRLRAAGCPAVRVLDAVRFDLGDVRRWLDGREAGGGSLRVLDGGLDR